MSPLKRRHIARAVAFGGAAILISGSAALMMFNTWPRQSDSFTPIDTGQTQSLDAIVTEPKTSAIQLVPLPSDPKARSQ